MMGFTQQSTILSTPNRKTMGEKVAPVRQANHLGASINNSFGYSGQGSFVWVRTDLVEAILDNGGALPSGWKPRKRVRSPLSYNQRLDSLNMCADENDMGSWGWCRAKVSSSSAQVVSPNIASADLTAKSTSRRGSINDNQIPHDKHNRDTSAGTASNGSNPFGHVKLRKTGWSDHDETSLESVGAKQQLPIRLGSPVASKKNVSITIVVDDQELAPKHIQSKSVSFIYDASDLSMVCVENSWCQQQYLADNKDDNVPVAPPTDLTTLEHLHEPAIVFCLQRRYELNQIYTYTGKILIALNPFRSLDDIYTEEAMRMYWNGGMGCRSAVNAGKQQKKMTSAAGRPPPHVYAIAEDAYNSMMISLENSATPSRGVKTPIPENQSLLVSGESGAGKTVTTKIILRYLATISAEKHKTKDASAVAATATIESQILGWNPVLESFGNARTVRNDNSSRFGKFMEMQFDKSGILVSASLETYLLEKVRLITQAPGERNYHIFYEILSGLPKHERQQFNLLNKSPPDFRMTASSGTFDRRDGVEDRTTFQKLRKSLDTVGFTKEDQTDLFHVVCALLHMSNVTFVELSADGSVVDQTNPSLSIAISLLGVDEKALNDAMTKCAITVRNETVHKNLSVERAEKSIQAFIKTTYGALFTYIVKKINNSVATRSTSPGNNTEISPNSSNMSVARRDQEVANIGVLDIFGFESFEKNSFEQLCINYCNEALQQQFNRFVFKLEQQEYAREGIEWSFIEFPDNQDVLDLIEKKHDGILAILDEQCRLPKCNDATFAAAIYSKLSNHPRMQVSKNQCGRQAFAVQHYAGFVEYSTDLFLEKNKDELPKETTELLKSSSFHFLSNLGLDLEDEVSIYNNQNQLPLDRPRSNQQVNRSTSSLMKDSVGVQFCAQLRSLRARIETTAPHYIRCIKPNDYLIPSSFNHLAIADQLRCAGVLEAIRVSRIGFPHRYFHRHFVNRYNMLAPRKPIKVRGFRIPKLSDEEACESLVQTLTAQLKVHHDAPAIGSRSGSGRSVRYLGMQMGATKVFFRQKTFEALESIRFKKLEKSAITIQAASRMYCEKCMYRKKCRAIILLQCFGRKVELFRRMKHVKINRAASRIQAVMRGLKAKRKLISARWIAWWCQSAYRGAAARQYCAYLFLNQNAERLQRCWRNTRRKNQFQMIRSSFVAFQNHYRCRNAIRELLRLRLEARDLSRIAAERDKFKEESRRLREELEKARKESPEKSRSVPRETEMVRLRQEVQRLHFELEKAHRMQNPSKTSAENAKRLIEELADKEDELDRLKRELEGWRSRDEMSSIRSITVSTSCPSEFSLRLSKQHPSPSRTDSSLLDNDDDINYHTKRTFDAEFDLYDSTIEGEELQRLHNSIREGDDSLFDSVLHTTSEPCVLINQSDRFGRSAIHVAALSDQTRFAEVLIAKGAVVNAQDNDGETPLHLAEHETMTDILISKGKANPNIPNVDGICALHLAVQRRDVESVQLLVNHNANVNNADNVRWFTSLHLVAIPSRIDTAIKSNENARVSIAKFLIASAEKIKPDLNYQDSEGNTPLHYAVQLQTIDCYELITLLLESGANPNIRNVRDQIPLHLLCHNTDLRNIGNYQEIIHLLLIHGADPNLQSLTGCTPLHLSLYHRDIDTAVQLVGSGAELHLVWKKPKRWPSFWKDMGSSRVVALDMVEDSSDLQRILSAITIPNVLAPNRPWCMNCKTVLRKCRGVHCRHCSRLTCFSCSHSFLPVEYFPEHFKVLEPSSVCATCEIILTSKKEVMTNITYPTVDFSEEDENGQFSC